MLAAGDIYTLKVVRSINTNRETFWAIKDPKTESRLFSRFDQILLDKFQTQKLAFHYHDFGVPLADFKNNQKISSFFKILQTDTLIEQGNLEFVASVEAFNYPIYGTLYHPEYQVLEYGKPFLNNRNKDTLEILRQFAEFFRQEAYYNPNSFTDSKQFEGMSFANIGTLVYDLGSSKLILANGLKNHTSNSTPLNQGIALVQTGSQNLTDHVFLEDCQQGPVNSEGKDSQVNRFLEFAKALTNLIFVGSFEYM
ncbi:gamma-glutamyl hydrolase-like [Stylonychia lemnae]|uniref:Gamma-glutamyl hydrolase-like n=1 Tax=Stylonychia lemnae TaxID=5949 RepID=A0A078AJN9_STYLE|nr:gamma-glutamyl hydrolase-like [Stylonychia lemnae]|eukprot:CDW82106.1 gamma-glutamyl hydrolase-like [Stylonychia lemnae]